VYLCQVTLYDMTLLTSHCKALKYLEVLGLWEAGGDLQCLLPPQLLVAPEVMGSILHCESNIQGLGGGGA